MKEANVVESHFEERVDRQLKDLDHVVESLRTYVECLASKTRIRFSALEMRMCTVECLDDKRLKALEEKMSALQYFLKPEPDKLSQDVKGWKGFSHSMYLGKAVTIHDTEGEYPRKYTWRYNTEKGNLLYWRGVKLGWDHFIKSGEHRHTSFAFRVYKEPMGEKYYYLDTDTDKVYLLA